MRPALSPIVPAVCALVLASVASAQPLPGSAGGPSKAGLIQLAQIRLGTPVAPTPAPAPQAPAESGSVMLTTTPAQTLAAITGLGFTGEVVEQDGGKHLRVTYDGNEMYIWHDECDGEACRRITFYVNFGKQDSIDDTFLNSYNVDNVVTKMYRESEGNIALTMYSVLDGGVGPGWIKGQAERWVRYYKNALTYKPS